jgi:NADH:ubiquinone oxidoreductase subunit 5 (subunit L)/multisubunit Na+/H+ antiporter MnhA subunit
LLLLLVVALLALPLALFLQDFSRMIVTELLNGIQVIRHRLESIPQTVIWELLAVLVVVAAIGSLFGWSRPPLGDDAKPPHVPGHIRELSLWIRRAAEGRYFRWTLNRYMRNLAWDIMAYRARTTPRRLKHRFRAGDLDLPPFVAEYVESANILPAPSRPSLRELLFSRPGQEAGQHLRSGTGSVRPSPQLEALVQYLEDQLEVEHDPGID